MSGNRYNINMKLVDLLKEKHLTVYKLSKLTHLPLSTLSDIVTGKASLLQCRTRVAWALSKALQITIEELLELEQEQYKPILKDQIPDFLYKDIDKVKRLKNRNNPLFDCYLDQLNSSINVAEIEHLISKEQANYLRNKYLG